MNAMPAKVNSGDAVHPAAPVHAGSLFGIMRELRWRTATPFGRPVVPEVYMMSARSSSTGPGSRRVVVERVVPRRSVGDHDVTRQHRAAVSGSGPRGDDRGDLGVAEDRRELAAQSRVLVGTATAPALWTAA